MCDWCENTDYPIKYSIYYGYFKHYDPNQSSENYIHWIGGKCKNEIRVQEEINKIIIELINEKGK